MMNKEAILHKHVNFWNHKGEVAVDGINTITPESAIYKAMNEWGRQESIEFGNWLAENYYLGGAGFYTHDYQNKIHFTTEELYDQFLQTKHDNLNNQK